MVWRAGWKLRSLGFFKIQELGFKVRVSGFACRV